jgi:hypothetical protein
VTQAQTTTSRRSLLKYSYHPGWIWRRRTAHITPVSQTPRDVNLHTTRYTFYMGTLPHSRGGSYIVRAISIFVPVCLLLLYLISTTRDDFNHLGPDTDEYLVMSAEILSGELFRDRAIEEIPVGSVIRTPGFPLTLAVGQLLAPGNLRTAMLVGHSLLFLAAFLSIVIANRFAPSPWLLAALLFPALPQLREVFAGLASEWTAYCFLLFLFGSLLRFFGQPTTRHLLLIGVAASLTALARPALCIVVAMPFLAMVLLPQSNWLRRVALATCSLSLMWLWMGFNWHRLDSFSLAPRGGANIFCIGALIGKPSVHPEDPPEQREYFEALRKETFSATPEELAVERTLKIPKSFFANYVGNYEIADRIAGELGINRVKGNEYLGIYGLRSIRDNLSSYLLHLFYGAHNFSITLYLLIPSFVIPLLWIRKKEQIALSWSALSILSIHVGHLSLVLLTQPLLSRYYSVTFYPLLLASLAVIVELARKILAPSKPASF